MKKIWTKSVIERLKNLYSNHTYEEISKILNKEFKIHTNKNSVKKAFQRFNFPIMDFNPKNKPKILLFDIETLPLEAYIWSIWQDNVGLNMVKEDWSVLSWAAKWYGEDEVFYEDVKDQKNLRDDSKILKKLWKLLDEADYVCGHNSNSFDVKKINARFIQKGMKPPSSYKRLDTKVMAKRHFNFTSNKLSYLTEKLCTKYKKLGHAKFQGFSLWEQCLKRNDKAFIEMKKYNIYDVLSLEELFTKLLPWQSASLFNSFNNSEVPTCTCGHTKFKKSGFYYTNGGKFQKFTCNNCGSEYRDSKNLRSSYAPKMNNTTR